MKTITLECCILANCANIVFDSLSSLSFFQHNRIKNKYDSILDLIFSPNDDLSTFNSEDSLVLTDSYHPALLLNFNIKFPLCHVCPEYSIYDFRRTDYVGMSKQLGQVDWSTLFFKQDCNSVLDVFMRAILNMIIYLSLNFIRPLLFFQNSSLRS